MRKTKAKTPIKIKRIRVGRLDSCDSVAKFQARLVKRMVKGGDVNDCYKLAVVSSMLVKTLTQSDLEKRIEKLEQANL